MMAAATGHPCDDVKRKVFLSHNSADKPAIEALALRLRQEPDIEPWLDKWNLIPGQPWQEKIEAAIKACDSCAIFVGRGDPKTGVIGPWQNAEMRALINRQVSERGSQFAVIPVLLPGAERSQRSTLPTFLVANTWVEFRHTLDDAETFQRLVSGIRREKPGPPKDGRAALAECPYRGLEFFDVAHDDLFFGREAVTQWLVDDIRRPLRPGSELPRFLALLGASGSGKSSLARAGLYAALKKRDAIEGSRDWLFVPPLRPGPNPLESLELAVLQAAAGSLQLETVRIELRELASEPDRLHRVARLLVPDTSPRAGCSCSWTSSRKSSPPARRKSSAARSSTRCSTPPASAADRSSSRSPCGPIFTRRSPRMTNSPACWTSTSFSWGR
jgi:TIR domain